MHFYAKSEQKYSDTITKARKYVKQENNITMPVIDPNKLVKLQDAPERVRNVRRDRVLSFLINR